MSVDFTQTHKRSEMPEHLRRDDANPSEDLRGCQPWNNTQNYQILL